MFDGQSLARWFLLRQTKQRPYFFRHSLLAALLVTTWQLAVGCGCLQNVQCVVFEGWFPENNADALFGPDLGGFDLRSFGLYKFSFRTRVCTPPHLSLFSTLLRRCGKI